VRNTTELAHEDLLEHGLDSMTRREKVVLVRNEDIRPNTEKLVQLVRQALSHVRPFYSKQDLNADVVRWAEDVRIEAERAEEQMEEETEE
jgi:endogenous inhibitor of DNA gyrase (YacG/DUF329 family)